MIKGWKRVIKVFPGSKKKRAARFFPWAALNWAVLNFLFTFIIISASPYPVRAFFFTVI